VTGHQSCVPPSPHPNPSRHRANYTH